MMHHRHYQSSIAYEGLEPGSEAPVPHIAPEAHGHICVGHSDGKTLYRQLRLDHTEHTGLEIQISWRVKKSSANSSCEGAT
jgi:hypothetical protein